jgi:arsenate reductase-like glutaredoxin family protein
LRFGENAIKISTIGIIELYEKCGMLEKAKNTFNERNIEYHIRKRENQKELEKIKAKWEERNEKS